MALHNYIYSKHPHDVSTDNKIAKEHEPRPKILNLDSNISESHNNKLIDKYENEIHLDSIMADDILINDDNINANNDKTLNEHCDGEFGDIEFEDSSDSDFLRHKQNNSHIHNIDNHNHHHHHNHQTHNNDNIHDQTINEETSISLTKTNSSYISNSDDDSSNSLCKTYSRDSKWVIINGQKKKLKSRFNSKHENSLTSTSPNTKDIPLLTPILDHDNHDNHNNHSHNHDNHTHNHNHAHHGHNHTHHAHNHGHSHN